MRLFRMTLGIAAAAALGACGARGPATAQLGADALYERGTRELETRKWEDAILSWEQFSSRHAGDPRIEEARFRLGESYFGKKEYVTAASEFVRLANDFGSGEYADDARFKACESYVRLSPKAQLDQQYTEAAIEHCEAMIAWFPTSEHAPRAREIVDEMRAKLAQKAYLSGDYYLKRRAYDSSIIYFDTVVRDYPGTEFAPRALLKLVEVYRQLGYREEQETARQRLLRDYPSSAEAKQVQGALAGGA